MDTCDSPNDPQELETGPDSTLGTTSIPDSLNNGKTTDDQTTSCTIQIPGTLIDVKTEESQHPSCSAIHHSLVKDPYEKPGVVLDGETVSDDALLLHGAKGDCSEMTITQGQPRSPDATQAASDVNTDERERSRAPKSIEDMNLISKLTVMEIAGAQAATSAITISSPQDKQEKMTIEGVEEGAVEEVPDGDGIADGASAFRAEGKSGGSNICGADTVNDTPSSQSKVPEDVNKTEASQSELSESKSGYGLSSTLGATAPLAPERQETSRLHSINKSKYSTVSYRNIQKGNTRQRIDEFEARNT